MTDIYRTYRHTIVTCSIADLKTGRIKDIDYELHSTYKDQKTMITKLSNLLEQENKRFLGLKGTRIKVITYFMKPETFKEHADYYTVEENSVDNKETKTKAKKKGSKKS